MITVTTFVDKHDKTVANSDAGTWPDLVKSLSVHDERKGKEGKCFSVASYAENCTCKSCIKDGNTLGHAINANVLQVYALAFDLDKNEDGTPLTPDQALGWLKHVKGLGVSCVAYTSHSYSETLGAWRIVFELSRPVTAKEYKPMWKAAIKSLGIPSGIRTSADFPARVWYAPSCEPGAAHYTATFKGAPLNVDALLTSAPDVPEPLALSGSTSFGKAPEKLLAHVAQQLQNHGQAKEGENGSTHTLVAANILLNDYGLSEEEGWPMFRAWNVRNEPPWEESELRTRFTGQYATEPFGQKRDVYEFTSRLSEQPDDAAPGTFAHKLSVARKELKEHLNVEASDTNMSEMFIPASELMAKTFPKTPWLVRGLMTQGGVGVIGGEPKTFKTWLATEIAIAVASGDSAFGEFKAEKGKVAYFYSEDMETSIQNRLRSLCKKRGTVPTDLYCQPRGRDLDLCNDESLALLVASLRKIEGLKLLILDPFRDVHSAAEDSSDEMSKVMRRLRVLSTVLGCAVLFVHHTSKSGADTSTRRPGQLLRGSSAVHGGIDNGLYLSGTSGDAKTEFTNRVFTEVKGALGAGHFNLTLKIEDGPDGTAIDTTWTKSEGDAETEEDLNEVVSAIGCEILRGNLHPSQKEILKHTKGTVDKLKKHLLNAQTTGHIRKSVKDGIFLGWELTDKGHELHKAIAS